MDKRKILLALAAVFAVLAVCGVGYIIVKGGDVSGAYAFLPAVAAVVLYLNAKDDKKNK